MVRMHRTTPQLMLRMQRTPNDDVTYSQDSRWTFFFWLSNQCRGFRHLFCQSIKSVVPLEALLLFYIFVIGNLLWFNIREKPYYSSRQVCANILLACHLRSFDTRSLIWLTMWPFKLHVKWLIFVVSGESWVCSVARWMGLIWLYFCCVFCLKSTLISKVENLVRLQMYLKNPRSIPEISRANLELLRSIKVHCH